MSQSQSYNPAILNDLFTAREFEFINNIENDIDKINLIQQQEETNKSIIINLINHLNAKNNPTIVSEAQTIEGLISDNIKALEINRQTYDGIKQAIVDLLVKLEQEEKSLNESEFSSNIINLRNDINTFYNSIEKENLQLSVNRNKIDEFFNNHIVKQNLSKSKETPITNINIKLNNLNLDKKLPIKHGKLSDEKLEEISAEILKEDNPVLLISERENKVYLPYYKTEILDYLNQYPNQYKSFQDVIKQEFILPLDFYMRRPIIARFREAYSLIRDRESKSILEALKFAIDMSFRAELNPAIIAACKSQDQLENYLDCIEHRREKDFKDFEIIFEITPFA